jgi:nicotinamidase/pyrazinamidase
MTTLKPGDALIIVDLQNDFLPGGALAVPGGDQVLHPLNRLIGKFTGKNLPVFATRDWHPEQHVSFQAQGGTWPPHCVRNTSGAEFSPDLKLPPGATVISKATSADQDAYSGFEGTDLHDRLQKLGVERVFVGGLATDYCVLNTVKDALKSGYRVFFLADASRAVNMNPQDGDKAPKPPGPARSPSSSVQGHLDEAALGLQV